MGMELVTREDLEKFKAQLIGEIRVLFTQYSNVPGGEILQGLKTAQVRKILGCCTNTVKALRIAGKLRCKKEGGNWYYSREDVRKIVEGGFGK